MKDSPNLGAAGCEKIVIDSSFKPKTKADKLDTLEKKIWRDIQRNEIPEWNPNLVTSEEMTEAYASLANKKDAKGKNNLFVGLREKLPSNEKCL